jgi:hypothetical protein
MAKDAQPTDGKGRSPLPSVGALDHDLEQVRTALKGIQYGEVRSIIHGGVVVQIERVEKQRLS